MSCNGQSIARSWISILTHYLIIRISQKVVAASSRPFFLVVPKTDNANISMVPSLDVAERVAMDILMGEFPVFAIANNPTLISTGLACQVPRYTL
jgi:hypothetical protein